MKYNAAAAISCLPEGKYDAMIAHIERKKTRKGDKDMLVFTYTIYKPTGGEKSLKDYIVNPDSMWRLKKIAKAIDRLKEFESGEFKEADYLGCNVTLELSVEESDEYGDQNRISAWHPATVSKPRGQHAGDSYTPIEPSDIDKALAGNGKIPDEDVPF